MKFGLSKKELLILKNIFINFPEIDEVLIFGSRALGNFKNSYYCSGDSYSNSLFFISAIFCYGSINGAKF